jgi:adenine-specific DNA methylase
VQQTDATLFAERLEGVFRECHRVLKDDGLLVFTYHHARMEGWTSLHAAIRRAGFVTVKTHPVKAEMAVSVPVQQAKEPLSFDLIIVCRKSAAVICVRAEQLSLETCEAEARAVLADLRSGGQKLSVADAKLVLMGILLVQLAALGECEREIDVLAALDSDMDRLARSLM